MTVAESRFNKVQNLSARAAGISIVQANSNCKATLELIVKVKEFRHALQCCIPLHHHFSGV